MRPIRVVPAVLSVVLLSLVTLLGAPSAGATGSGYAALGDSYSAGVGAGSYLSDSGGCKRSTKAYPYLWNSAHAPSSFAFVACSGATTGDVLDDQLSALNSATGLVSISVGGNDAGFTDVMTTCVLHSESACLSVIADARSYADHQLPPRLDRVYAAIRDRAPNARVVVLGYPHLYRIEGSCLFGIGDTRRAAINGAADELDSVMAKRAADAGFTFADVRGAFTNHEICSGSSWIHSTTWPIDESYHPNASGQAYGYLPTFSAAA